MIRMTAGWMSALLLLAAGPVHAQSTQALSTPPEFTTFESGQVRPLALSPDGTRLFATNTPDGRLEIFDVTATGLDHAASVPVGLEPVAVAARSNTEVWVVNHLSDSVSVVLVQGRQSRVVRTLLVGDEPRDIVFAGADRNRAFITTAHRGQNVPYNPQFTTPGIGRADVWVFDASQLGSTLGGSPLTILTLFTDTPRALAVTPDGTRVYAAGFHSGNQTTSVPAAALLSGTYLFPLTNFQLMPIPPLVGLIVKWNGTNWVDENGLPRDGAVRLSLPDKDVFAIDAMASPPRLVSGSSGFFTQVGTILFNMAVNPANGKVYVSNTDANNLRRFEGPGIFAGHSIRGRLHESRITVLEPGAVKPRHLNKHIDYSKCCAPIPNPENERSLAFPLDMTVTGDGSTLYVSAFGSSKIGVYDTSSLENDTFVPNTANQIRVSGGGPTGLALDENNGRLYALTRFDNAISIIDTAARAEVGHVPMHNPEPPHVVAGRRFLYDASLSSSHGDSACASCHVFGDVDSLAWDLGNPDDIVTTNPNPFTNPVLQAASFHPMKGPMVTQSLRGLANHGPMHWRGDRTGGYNGPSVQPSGGAFDEHAAFMAFRPAFENLLGRGGTISAQDMNAFTNFMLEVMYPPNPIRHLDNSLTPSQQRGRDKFFNDVSFLTTGTFKCNECHTLDRTANANLGERKPGFFGSNGESCELIASQHTKNTQLRNAYQKIGMFGMAFVAGLNPGDNGHKGDQVRGFGFFHDGTVDTIFRFFQAVFFNQIPLIVPGGFPIGFLGDSQRRDMEAFMLAFDSNFFPIVGQQITLSAANGSIAGPRITLLEARADLGECDLIVRGDEGEGYLYTGAGHFIGNHAGNSQISDAVLRARASSRPLTFTCVPPGSGRRMGVDRDMDGLLDGDEAGTH